MVLWILGLSHSSHLGEASFISSMGIVMVPVFARLFFGDRPPASTWFALPLALAGFACLSLDGGFEVELGQWFFLGAATGVRADVQRQFAHRAQRAGARPQRGADARRRRAGAAAGAC
jgi:hypothetical protein